ncbi:hypothetical protein [Bradyrhizobium diazoefficiens]|nr:hypothetical protein XF16B_46070 [Bradyrhizobium diazoefficiens]BCF70260.1 hypothetical protein XF19B_46130 [Bradyrhizobium diazoefficiens]
MSRLTLAQGDDWSGIYVDGQLVTEGHSIRTLEVVEICIEHKVTVAEGKLVDIPWLNEQGSLPQREEEVVWE